MATNSRSGFIGSMEAEPAVKAKGANKHLALKNSRAANNWLRVRNVLEKEKKEFAVKIDDDRSKLLKQRERLQHTSLGLNAVAEKKEDDSADIDKCKATRRMTFSDVYDALVMTVREQNNRDAKSVQSDSVLRRGSTISYDQKKVLRKPMNVSLQGLQRANSNLQSKLLGLTKTQELDEDDEKQKEDEEQEKNPMLGPFDLNNEEKSLGPTLRLPPTTLPPIRSQMVFQPRTTSFDKRRASSNPTTVEDVRYCRYLRSYTSRGGRRSSAPAVRPGRNLVYASRTSKPTEKK